jgi:murein DD-endopeptidase MepM/ murein hydrolase activator NlpD
MPLAAAALALLVAAGPAAKPGAADLARAREARAAAEAAARALAAEEVSILAVLDDAQRARAGAERALARADAEHDRARAALERARAAEEKAGAAEAAALARLRPRLAARARMAPGDGLRLLAAGGGSAADLARRRYLLERILASDAALLREARAQREAREAARAAREAELQRLAAAEAAAAARRAEAGERASAQRALLAALRSERKLRQRAAAEAAAQERRLLELLGGTAPGGARPPAGPAAAPASGFAALRGRLPRPADGPVVAGFGRIVDARFQTETNHPGVEIRAERGATVRAVAPGKVVHAGWFRGYGNLVILDHGAGYHTLVAHLAAMSTAVGEEVGAGAPLGTVGDTGSLRGDGVYFEIRERQRPVDPAVWLAPAAGDIVRP